MTQRRRLAKNLPMPVWGRFLWSAGTLLIRGLGRALFSLRIEREGPLPPPPYVVAANHYSHLDPPVIGAALGVPIRYLALEDLFVVSRFLDWLMLGFGAIPTPRDRLPIRAVRVALARLKAGDVIAVFPEATRVSHWGTLPSKRGAAWLARRAQVPLVPVAVIGTGRVFGLDKRLHRSQVRVVIGRGIEPGQHDVTALTGQWEDWITSQIRRFPESEVKGPPRSQHPGP